jgi:hypothetical protein
MSGVCSRRAALISSDSSYCSAIVADSFCTRLGILLLVQKVIMFSETGAKFVKPSQNQRIFCFTLAGTTFKNM